MVRKAIILADGPAALLRVANRPLAAHALKALGAAGITRALVTARPAVRRELDRQLGDVGARMAVSYIEHDTSGPLTALPELERFVAGDPFVLHLSDSLERECLSSALQVPTGDLDSTVLVQEAIRDERVVDLAHRRAGPGALDEAGPPAGVWLLGAGALEAVRGVEPAGSAELDLATACRRLAERGGRISVRRVSTWWRYCDRPEALLEGNRFALEGLRPTPTNAELRDTRLQGAVAIHDSARLEGSIVRGPAVIGAGACLRDAYIGPYTSIGEDVSIEGAEIEHSIIEPGASVKHLGARLEASIVGPRARIFRDFRLPKATRLTIGEGAEVSLA
jgi:glucose-1-phosphate thymidylyltransferase